MKQRPAKEKERPPHHEKYQGYTISTWLTEEGAAMNRRAKEVIDDVPSEGVGGMSDGAVGWRYHWRHGMVGSVQYWADGQCENVTKMLVGLAKEFRVTDQVAKQLDPERDSSAAERAVGRNVREALAGLKPRGGSTERQREQYNVVLAAAFRAPAKAHDPRG